MTTLWQRSVLRLVLSCGGGGCGLVGGEAGIQHRWPTLLDRSHEVGPFGRACGMCVGGGAVGGKVLRG